MRPALLGRAAELRRLAALAETGGALLLLGEAGMGKTTILSTVDATVAVSGLLAERDVPFAALHRLLAPLTDRFPLVPAQQAEALRDAVGLAGRPDGFLLRCGVHRLLTVLAETAPVRVCVDDAQWLDAESLAVLAFAARRLAGHPVAVVLAARPELARPGHDPLAGIPRMWLPPLPEEACERLLPLPAGVRAVLTELAGGNPQDLLALAESLSPAQLADRAPLPEVLPEGRAADYRARLAALSPPARLLLVCVAAEPSADLEALHGCATPAAVEELLTAGLLRLAGTAPRLPSPLVRATLYHLATAAERQAAHAFLATALTGPRRIWHQAMAAPDPGPPLGDAPASAAPDPTSPLGDAPASAAADPTSPLGDALASDAPGPSPPLGDALASAAAGTDPATATSLLERAAVLTVHPDHRATRLLAAAEQAWLAGRPGRARTLLSRCHPSTRQAGREPTGTSEAAAAVLARAALLRGEIELRDGEPAVATHELAAAAEELADPTEAATALLLAGEARRLGGDLAGYQALSARVPGLLARFAATGRTEPVLALAAAQFAGASATFTGRHARAREPLREVVALGSASTDGGSAVWAAEAAFALGDLERTFECAAAAVSRARAGRRAAALPWALVHLALAAITLDRHRVAQAATAEGLAASVAAGQRNTWAEHLSLRALSAALLGDREVALAALDSAAPGIAARALGRPGAVSAWALACLDLVDDRPGDALGRLETLCAGVSGDQPAIRVLTTAQLVEAAVRAEQPDRVTRALATFDEWVLAGADPAWLALSHRCHGLLAEDLDGAEHHFRTALTLHRRAGSALELARTQLAYANRLRRHRRTRMAREQFRAALRGFRLAGADHWAERARTGLRASGESVEDARATLAGLTPQQAEISRLVAVGETNKEIARRLVISHRTVDHHLRNIFATLGVRSRVELARRVTDL
ncbi:helix-turn-helix transcriptional regulator [Actinophytocola xanthii]|uniref:HTH luxR-type domain-containing protein n=1 Tax=Actinophytocola xanthii TaxID=1912961 RepID=A0A1Q8CLC3_9PSEU|nr:LuxR C-terminal-related transcriptional regulator [Actinophytocola xanthii]OLF15151.1 hypothetical protein BU204_23050 [Actinophytocola xanthii]